ncbi:hypothetical protein [Vaginella massiliensis]|uniref:hypothetical protein n=1 Tax=Vaginella massiliensis TaxID=1816680 RepID=UPI000839379A|nr:hypothetical protein [Vaginella massiliensis]
MNFSKLYFALLAFFTLKSCSSNQYGLTYPTQEKQTTASTTLLSTIDDFKISYLLNPITVRVNVIILQDEKRKVSNFDLNNSEEKKLLEDYFERTNLSWSKFYKPVDLHGCYTGNDFYEDSKIRFQFNFIPYKDAAAWSYTTSGAKIETRNYSGFVPSDNWYLHRLDLQFMNDTRIPKGILVYLTTDGDQFDELYNSKGKGYDIKGIEASQTPSTTNLTRNSSINVPNRYLKYLMHRYQAPKQFNTTWEETRNWHLADAVGTAHELGHSLGLSHSNPYHGTNQCKYSLMSQNWEHPRNYVQPTEIIKAHKNLRETNLIQFVTEDSFLGNTFLIDKDTHWTHTQRFYSNLWLQDGVTLTISEPIILAPQAFIEFGKNSKIVFEKNGKITLPNGKVFENFRNKKSTSISKL